MRRLTITLLLVVLVSIFGLGVALDILFERYSSAPQDELTDVKSLTSGFATVLNQSDNPADELDSWPEQNQYQASVEALENLSFPQPLYVQLKSGEPLILESENSVSIYYFLPSHEQVLIIDTPIIPDAGQTPMAILFTSLFYLGTLLLVLMWLKPLLSRLNLLRKTTRAFGAGSLSSRVPEQGVSYIRDIESDFNSMADRIQQLINDNKLLTSAVSHDLRTPLARLRFGVDTLAESTDPEARNQYHRRISNDLSEMENQVNALLRYARLDNVLSDVEKQPVSLRQLLQECTAQYYDSNIIIKIDDSALKTDDTLTITGCIEHLATMLNNLIQNATDHAGSKLIIELKNTGKHISVTFNDDGPGIDEHQRSTVLKPFQRGTENANSGYGLGLAVVERIARHHNAAVEINSAKSLGGASVAIVFSPGLDIKL